MEKENVKPQLISIKNKVILGFIFIVIAAVLTAYYVKTSNNLKNLLKENLATIVYFGALNVNGDMLEQIKSNDDVFTNNYIEISNELNKIKKSNKDIRYVYTMRKTDQENVLEFIVDADNPLTVKNNDLNGNNIIEEEEELSYPGDAYDITSLPQMKEAFNSVVSDQNITKDKWGRWLSAYAPIKNSKNETVAILGIDMSAMSVENVLDSTQNAGILILILILAVSASFYIIIITKQREIQIAEESNQLKSTFLTSISHELRTPIIAICGFTELILETNKKLSSETKSHIESIKLFSNKLIKKTNNIIEFARIKGNKAPINKSEFYIKDIIYDIKKSIEPMIKENNINFKIDLNPANEKMISDKDKCYDILNNLIINAIKFTPSGGNVNIKIQKQDKKIRFEVEDTGIGIAKKYLKHIFNDFTQVETNQAIRKYKGSGLGLSIVKGLTELLKGTIEIQSTAGIGSKFTVILPND